MAVLTTCVARYSCRASRNTCTQGRLGLIVAFIVAGPEPHHLPRVTRLIVIR